MKDVKASKKSQTMLPNTEQSIFLLERAMSEIQFPERKAKTKDLYFLISLNYMGKI